MRSVLSRERNTRRRPLSPRGTLHTSRLLRAGRGTLAGAPLVRSVLSRARNTRRRLRAGSGTRAGAATDPRKLPVLGERRGPRESALLSLTRLEPSTPSTA